MLGSGRAWLRWLAAAVVAVGLVRLAFYLVLPVLPQPFAWAGALMLGLSAVFLLLPLPHEALLVQRPSPEQRPDRPASG